jgi:protein-disulfide isomerase
MNRIALYAASLFIALPLCTPAFGQYSAPPNTGTTFKDTSMLKPPPGARVAIYEFEDLECPACAHAFPITRAAAEHYKIPMLHHDFPLKMHIWSLDAAITARYMQDKISPQAAEDYRRAVFANQNAIASKEDLQNFTRHYFQTHGKEMPFVVDPTGQFAREVNADYQLGERVGLTQTPTIFVVTPKHWIQVTDVSQLYQTIDTALAETPAATAHNAAHNMRRTSKPQR